MFYDGTVISLSKIRDMINDKSNINIISPEDKKIQFCAFDRAGESLFAF